MERRRRRLGNPASKASVVRDVFRSRPRLPLVPICAAALAVTLAGGSAARTSSQAGGRWPDGEIRVYDASGWNHAVALALGQWNAAELGVRFAETDLRAEADVVIVANDVRVRAECADVCAGYTTWIGFRGARQATQILLPERTALEEADPTIKDVQLLVHEFGHVLGLRHRDEECKVMNPDLARDCDPMRGGDAWLCGPLPRDLAKAEKLYGVRPAEVNPYCLR